MKRRSKAGRATLTWKQASVPANRNWEAFYLWKKHRHKVLPDKKKTIPRKRKYKDDV